MLAQFLTFNEIFFVSLEFLIYVIGRLLRFRSACKLAQSGQTECRLTLLTLSDTFLRLRWYYWPCMIYTNTSHLLGNSISWPIKLMSNMCICEDLISLAEGANKYQSSRKRGSSKKFCHFLHDFVLTNGRIISQSKALIIFFQMIPKY